MKSALVVWWLALVVVSARARSEAAGPRYTSPQAFRAPIEDEALAPSVIHLTRQQNIPFRPQEGPRNRAQEYVGKRPILNKLQTLKEEELEEEEKEEPDRLTLLLPQSKFNCESKRTGYYADEGLNCEVFHYCQDNARHSWICPEGFVFHQVHLICMPPSSDNICSQSSQFHFVNEYLYKPINIEEVQKKPNVTLRYSERYYPENFYSEEDINQHRPEPTPQQVYTKQVYRTTVAPQPLYSRAHNQVFHSPEEVNIPLQHRRPIVASPQSLRNYSPHSSEEYEY